MEPVRYSSRPAMNLVGVRHFHTLATAQNTIPTQWAEFRANPPIVRRPGQEVFGVSCGVSEGQLEYMCAVEVESLNALSPGAGKMMVPAQNYAVFVHEGPVAALGDTWSAILKWLRTAEYESAESPDFEVYGPEFDPLAKNARVEVWVGVKRKGGNVA